jgi:hypothetical protein
MAANGVLKPDPYADWLAVLHGHTRLTADIQRVRTEIVTLLDRQIPTRCRWPADRPPTATDRFAVLARLAYADRRRRQAWQRAVPRRQRFVLTVLDSLLNQGGALLAAHYLRLPTKSPGVSPTVLEQCFKVLLVTDDWPLGARHLALWANAARHSRVVVEVHLGESLPLDTFTAPSASPRTRRITALEPAVRALVTGTAGGWEAGEWEAHIGSLRQAGELVSPSRGVDGRITVWLRGGIDPAAVGRLVQQGAEQLRPYLGTRPESKRGPKTDYALHLRRYQQWAAWREAEQAAGRVATAERFAAQVADGLAGEWRAWPADVKEIAKEATAVAWWLDPVSVEQAALVVPRYRSVLGDLLRAAGLRYRATVHEMVSTLRSGRRPLPASLPAGLPAPEGPGPFAARLQALLWVPALLGANVLRHPGDPWAWTAVYNVLLLLFLGLFLNGYRPERGDNLPFQYSPWLENTGAQSSSGGEISDDIAPVDVSARQA